MVRKKNKGVSLVEALVCMVIIGIGFVAMIQLSAYSISLMDRSIERNKMNFLSEMVLEDMIGDPYNASDYSNFNMTCNYSNPGGSSLSARKKNRWRKTIYEKDFIRFDKGSGYKDKKPPCNSKDSKKTYVSTVSDRTMGRVNFFTNKGKNKKYLGVVVK
tara:strand:+ start:115 stop:591 length:477 start_codon:yes stop_codon:yes gene_type:complete